MTFFNEDIMYESFVLSEWTHMPRQGLADEGAQIANDGIQTGSTVQDVSDTETGSNVQNASNIQRVSKIKNADQVQTANSI